MTKASMTSEEIDQFLTCARVGRLGLTAKDGPYIVPVGYGYANGEIFFHTCEKGSKTMELRKNSPICFEVDESLSDISMYKSVIARGRVQIIEEKDEMIPYLQKLIDKYRVLLNFDSYMSKAGRNRESELKSVRICVMTPDKTTGIKHFEQANSI